jgi:hypothetical protein
MMMLLADTSIAIFEQKAKYHEVEPSYIQGSNPDEPIQIISNKNNL